MNKPPAGVARFDSSAAMVLAVASYLRGQPFGSPSQSARLDWLMRYANRLPRSVREWAYSMGGVTEAISRDRLRQLDIEHIAAWTTGLYPQRTCAAAFVGSSNGALVHLAAALDAPWLPQTFLCPVRAFGSDPDDARHTFDDARRDIDALLANQPCISVHHMQDPNQDRLMSKTMRYFRVKHRVLPAAYREFLTRTLPRGATLYVDVCTLRWPVTRTSERSVFQFGGLGGATLDEYFHGGARVHEFLARYRAIRARWQPPAPNDTAPEAEWGFEPALLADLGRLAREMGWRLVELRFEEPEALSFVTASLYRDWYGQAGIESRRLIVDSFLLLDPFTTVRLHALPFWLAFCVEPSANALRRFLDREPAFDEIDLMLFSHGTESVGIAPIDTWRELLAHARCEGRFVGVDEARFPLDFATFAEFHRTLERLGPRHAPPAALSPAEFERLVHRYAALADIACEERTPSSPDLSRSSC